MEIHPKLQINGILKTNLKIDKGFYLNSTLTEVGVILNPYKRDKKYNRIYSDN